MLVDARGVGNMEIAWQARHEPIGQLEQSRQVSDS
jgi:hypothetical protein